MAVTTATRPVYLCWNHAFQHFIQVGQGPGAAWFQRDGSPINETDLYPYRAKEEFRESDLWNSSWFRTIGELGLMDRDEALQMLDERLPQVGYPVIFMGDSEYGNEAMQQVADEWFDEHPDEQFVEVYEHGGWFLGFRRDGSIWSTANDMAQLTKVWPQPANGCTGEVRRRL